MTLETGQPARLVWRGVRAGNGSLPATAEAFDRLLTPAVYIWYRQYPAGMVAYIGKTSRLARRLAEWYASFLSGSCRVRREDGTIYSDGNHWEILGNVERLPAMLEVTRAEVERTRFLYAPCDSELTAVEARLICALAAKASADETIVCGNSSLPTALGDLRVEHDLSRLDSDDRSAATRILLD